MVRRAALTLVRAGHVPVAGLVAAGGSGLWRYHRQLMVRCDAVLCLRSRDGAVGLEQWAQWEGKPVYHRAEDVPAVLPCP